MNRLIWIRRIFCVCLLLLSSVTFSEEFSLGKIIAYPNPFNPETDTITIRPEGFAAFSGMVDYTVYNFNQRAVFSGTASNSAIYWSGHSTDGQRVKPGLYFVKIIVNRSDYSVGTSIIKILIK